MGTNQSIVFGNRFPGTKHTHHFQPSHKNYNKFHILARVVRGYSRCHELLDQDLVIQHQRLSIIGTSLDFVVNVNFTHLQFKLATCWKFQLCFLYTKMRQPTLFFHKLHKNHILWLPKIFCCYQHHHNTNFTTIQCQNKNNFDNNKLLI